MGIGDAIQAMFNSLIVVIVILAVVVFGFLGYYMFSSDEFESSERLEPTRIEIKQEGSKVDTVYFYKLP